MAGLAGTGVDVGAASTGRHDDHDRGALVAAAILTFETELAERARPLLDVGDGAGRNALCQGGGGNRPRRDEA